MRKKTLFCVEKEKNGKMKKKSPFNVMIVIMFGDYNVNMYYLNIKKPSTI